MKIRQLQYVLETYRNGNRITAAAEMLHTSQPGMSRQIQLLEAELGFEVFNRQRNRIVSVTEPGREVVAIAQRMLADAERLRRLGDAFSQSSGGTLAVATTHTHARYVLPDVITRFSKLHPQVRLELRQESPMGVREMVDAGGADIGIGTDSGKRFSDLVVLPCFNLGRSLVAPTGHPVLRLKKLTLEAVARYPLITHGHSGNGAVLGEFRKAGIEPHVVFGALDADVSKTYVKLGMGIAIVTTLAFSSRDDKGLRARDASHLFPSSTTGLAVRAHSYLRNFTYDFIQLIAPHLTEQVVRDAVAAGTA
ncbi:LysR substrate-binding domain-containing protein [Hydrogenophaga sp. 2FB]|uniref:LysR substrate-binding domain-containing protein n=1 Tax=Hydrogenophaga sp. 2FB TaxID=2502187 RepID=UPI0010F512A6|nr:LysR substrate-binding domain-containing protein [Hydrogenophaga sp. 2FB]